MGLWVGLVSRHRSRSAQSAFAYIMLWSVLGMAGCVLLGYGLGELLVWFVGTYC